MPASSAATPISRVQMVGHDDVDRVDDLSSSRLPPRGGSPHRVGLARGFRGGVARAGHRREFGPWRLRDRGGMKTAPRAEPISPNRIG